MPSEIEKLYPEYWEDDDNEGHKNLYEEELLRKQLARFGRKEKLWFDKVSGIKLERRITDNLKSILENDLSVMVFNFVDMISHARTEMDMIKELASNEKAYRSLTMSWFNHSSLLELLKSLSDNDIRIIVTTDHGAIRVSNPVKVIGDRETNTNLRYKLVETSIINRSRYSRCATRARLFCVREMSAPVTFLPTPPTSLPIPIISTITPIITTILFSTVEFLWKK